LSGADIIRKLHTETEIAVVLSERVFGIPASLVDWMKRSLHAAHLAAEAKKNEAKKHATDKPSTTSDLPSLYTPSNIHIETPVELKKTASAPDALQAESHKKQDFQFTEMNTATVPSKPVPLFDINTLKTRCVTDSKTHVEIFIPSDWQQIARKNGMRFLDPATGTKVEVDGIERDDVSLDQWQEMRLPTVTREMPFLQATGVSYVIDGDQWRHRIRAYATEYQGTFHGDSEPSHYLICCYRTDRMLVTVSITAKSRIFTDQHALHKWLLSHIDIGEPLFENVSRENRRVTTTNSIGGERSTPKFFGLSTAGRIGRLRYLAYPWAFMPLMVLAGVASAMASFQANTMMLVAGIIGLSFLWLGIRLTVLRLHDLNLSGFWMLLPCAIGILGAMTKRPEALFFLFAVIAIGNIILIFAPGNQEENRYGPVAEPNSFWVILGAVLMASACLASGGGRDKIGRLGQFPEFPWSTSRGSSSPTPYSPSDNSFTINFPGKPAEKQTPRSAILGSGLSAINNYGLDLGSDSYLVQRIDFENRPNDRTQTIDAVRDMFVLATNGKTISDHTIYYEGNAAKEVRTKLPNGVYGNMRIILVDTRVYVIYIQSPDEQITAKTSDFLDSFHIK
ncbi:MAG: DUF805 domain-containing protein, partial [Undibacterium sp.]|nr:DUF805 domain-containing protein [Undibacterium sp.]